MGEMKPTPGPWKVSQNVSRHVVGPTGGVIASAELSCKQEISEANARLIAEAGTVFHDTGLSPVQLVEQRDELVAVVKALIVYDEYDHEDGVQMMLDYADMLKGAYAALAKCEGVGNDR